MGNGAQEASWGPREAPLPHSLRPLGGSGARALSAAWTCPLQQGLLVLSPQSWLVPVPVQQASEHELAGEGPAGIRCPGTHSPGQQTSPPREGSVTRPRSHPGLVHTSPC